MTIKSSKVIIADLNSKFNEIQEEKSDSVFFLKIAHYGKYILDNEILVEIVKPLYEESEKDISSFKEAWKQFYGKWKILAKDLLEKAKRVGLKDSHPLQNEIVEIKKGLENATISYDNDEIHYLYRPYFELIKRFKDAGKEKTIANTHLEKHKKTGSKLDFELNKVNDEWEKFKRLREVGVWWAHYKIELLIYGAYGRGDKKPYFDSNRISDAIYQYEIERISKDGSFAPVYLKRVDYGKWVKRLHNYLIPRVESLNSYDLKSSKSELKIEETGASSRRAYEKKCNVLQAIWDVYESHSRPDSILVPVARLTIKGRDVQLIDGIIEGLKKEGVFQEWEREDRYYDLQSINHEKLPRVYGSIGETYKELVATTYQEQNRNREVTEKQTETSGGTPYCVIEKGIGYLKFGKHGTKNKIGKSDGRPLRLLQSLLEPHIGVNKTVDAVFEAIRLPKDKDDTRLTGWSTSTTRKVEIIQYAIKELQKCNKLGGKIRFHFNVNKTQINAELMV